MYDIYQLKNIHSSKLYTPLYICQQIHSYREVIKFL